MEIQVLLLSADLDHPFVELTDIVGDTFHIPLIHKRTQLLQESVHSLGTRDAISAVLVQNVLPNHIKDFLQLPVICKTVVFMVEGKKFDNSFVIEGGTVTNFVLGKLWEPPIELTGICTPEKVEFQGQSDSWQPLGMGILGKVCAE